MDIKEILAEGNAILFQIQQICDGNLEEPKASVDGVVKLNDKHYPTEEMLVFRYLTWKHELVNWLINAEADPVDVDYFEEPDDITYHPSVIGFPTLEFWHSDGANLLFKVRENIKEKKSKLKELLKTLSSDSVSERREYKAKYHYADLEIDTKTGVIHNIDTGDNIAIGETRMLRMLAELLENLGNVVLYEVLACTIGDTSLSQGGQKLFAIDHVTDCKRNLLNKLQTITQKDARKWFISKAGYGLKRYKS